MVPIFMPYLALILLLFRQFLLSALAFVFTLFIAPTSLPLPVTRTMAILDVHQLATRIDNNIVVSGIIALGVGAAVYLYRRSTSEALASLLLLGVLVALLSVPEVPGLQLPESLRVASDVEGQIVPAFVDSALNWILSGGGRLALLGIIFGSVLVVIAIRLTVAYFNSGVAPYLRSRGIAFVKAIPGLAAMGIVVVAVVIFTPYIYNIYPIPHYTEYYVGVLRTPWLPAEKFSLSTDRSYYGYALTTDSDWFVVLLARTRKIVYIPTHDVLRRAVCETASQRTLPTEPPLVTIFYASPPKMKYCADRKYLRK